MTRVSYIIATYNRCADLKDTIVSVLQQEGESEIIVVSNSTDETNELFQDDGPFVKNPAIRYFHYDSRMGVTKARNVGYKKANGDILVTIDDDVIFENKKATKNIINAFDDDGKMGLAAFRVINHYSGEIEFPVQESSLEKAIPGVKPRVNLPKNANDDSLIETTHFPGCGNAIRASVFEDVGMLPPDFFYGGEEEDLSFRLLDSGYRIKYLPTVTIRHKRSPKGRISDQEELQKALENRIKVALRNLPPWHALKMSMFWIGRTYVRSRFDPRPTVAAIKQICLNWNNIMSERDAISKDTIYRIKRLGGRLY